MVLDDFDVLEPCFFQTLENCGPLIIADFKKQPAAGPQHTRRLFNQRTDQSEPVRTAVERQLRFVIFHRRIEIMADIGKNIRRVGHNHVEC